MTLKNAFGICNIEEAALERQIVPLELLTQLEKMVEVDMERYASDLAADYMEAYYKVSTGRTFH